MKIYAPDYYREFSCIAGKCRHSCCIGWEIDIDSDTYKYYKSVDGEFSKRLTDGICVGKDAAHFKLGKGDRCPFLNKDNLCDIILQLGEDKLCQICTDHPRYRSFFDSRIEIGLGLCCEAAGALILNRFDKMKLVEIENDGEDEEISLQEQAFFKLRSDIFDMLQNREKSVEERVKETEVKYGAFLPEKSVFDWADIYLNLEHLDSVWVDRLNELKELNLFDKKIFEAVEWEAAFEQLLVYFIGRHLSDGLYDGLLCERISFAFLSLYMICLLCMSHYKKYGSITTDDLIETARLYSSEIEYSEENITALLEILSRKQ